MHDRCGFTLVEMMLVLSLTLILASIGFVFHPPTIKSDQEILLLESAFKNARMKACALKEKQTIDVNDQDIYIYDTHDDTHLSLPRGYHFLTNHTFSYNAAGHINKPKTLILQAPHRSYSFVFQLGSGTFYVE